MEKLIGRYIANNYDSHSYSKLYLLSVYLYVYLLRRNKSKYEVTMFFNKKKEEMDMTLYESSEYKIKSETIKVSSCSIMFIVGHVLLHAGFVLAGNVLSGLAIAGFSVLLIKSLMHKRKISSDTPEKALAS